MSQWSRGEGDEGFASDRYLLNILEQQVDIAAEKKKPWVLLFGPRGTGKTSLLTHAAPPLIRLNKKYSHSSAHGVDWWLKEEQESAIFIDPADDTALPIFRQLLRLLKKKKNRLASACFVIDLPSLLYPSESNFQQLVKQFSQQVHALTQIWQPVFLNIILTQCDYIFGFPEFFHNLSKEDQEQPFGFSLRDGLFKQRFELFIEMINRRWLTRLHHEPNKNRRIRIYDLPFQLEWLMQPLNMIVSSIPSSPSILLNNLFFCSSKQTTETINLLSGNFSQAFKFKPTTDAPLIKNQRALFIPKMLEELAKTSPIPYDVTLSKSTRSYIFAYSSALLVIGLAAIAIHYDYQKDIRAVKKIASVIHTSDFSRSTDLIATLDTLDAILKKLADHNPKRFFNMHTTDTLKNTVQTTYIAYLRHSFLNYLNNILISAMKTEDPSHLAELYRTLKVYLILNAEAPAQPQKIKRTIIKEWFAQYWHQNPHLQIYLDALLDLPSATEAGQTRPAIDMQTVERVRNQIRQIPDPSLQDSLAQLGLALLLKPPQGIEVLTSLDRSLSIPGVRLDKIRFPAVYARTSFSDMYNQKIPTLAQQLLEETPWMLANTESLNQLTTHIQALYLEQYVQQWRKILTDVEWLPAKTVDDQVAQIQMILTPHSPLWHLYEEAIAQAQTQIQAQAQAEQTDFLSPNNLAPFVNLKNSLENTTAYDIAVEKLTHSPHTDPITRLLTSAPLLPEPLQSWAVVLANQTWSLVLNQSKIYLETLWQRDVMPVYYETIKNRYPIDPQSNTDISIEHFNQFFGPGGIIQVYFNQISPFLDTSGSNWTLRDTALPITQTHIDTLMQASLLQKMFYSKQLASPSIAFTLTPLTISPEQSDFTMNIGGQMLHYTNNSIPAAFTWPGNDGAFITLRFSRGAQHDHSDDSPNDDPTVTWTGPWAWFHLLDQALLESEDAKNFRITFRINQHQVTYRLSTDNPIHPYSSNLARSLIHTFHCEPGASH